MTFDPIAPLEAMTYLDEIIGKCSLSNSEQTYMPHASFLELGNLLFQIGLNMLVFCILKRFGRERVNVDDDPSNETYKLRFRVAVDVTRKRTRC
jgi:hypothetical protein